MKRLRNWEQSLAEVVAAAQLRPFSWHHHHCGIFVGDCVLAQTGVDPISPLREMESAVVLLEYVRTFGTFADCVTALLGVEPCHPSQAGRGDPMLAPSPKGDSLGATLGTCLGARCAFVAEVGLVLMPRRIATLAWRLG